MNFSSKNPEKFPVDVPLVKNLLIRLITRNEADKSKAFSDRLALQRNFESLNISPEAHLVAIMGEMEKMAVTGRIPDFGTGLFFGVAMTLSARSGNGKQMLSRMLLDIEKQQDGKLTDYEKIEAQLQLASAVPDEAIKEETKSE